MKQKEDRRVRRTKRQLKQAFTMLLKEKPIQEIKVREIADIIDINRGTFYQHYRDIYDMQYRIEDELFENFNQILEETDSHLDSKDSKVFLTKIFTFLKENSDLTIALMGPNGDPVFVDKVKNLVREHFIQEWKPANSETANSNFDYYYAFVVSGFVGLLQTWLENGARETPEELADLAIEMLQKGIKVLDEKSKE